MYLYILLGLFGTIVWIVLLRVLYKAKLPAWFELVGTFGLFILSIVYLRPILVDPLAKAVAGLAGIFGRITDTFHTYFKYGIIFIESIDGSISLKIDFECSGIIEILAYLSLLIFFKVYNLYERIILSIIGTFYILIANAIRIILICEIIHFNGTQSYYIAHTYLGRIFFYMVTVFLYFYVFTKSQVVRMKVGSFSYNKKKDKTEEEKDNRKETQNDDKAGEAKVDSTVTVKEETSENKELNTEKEDNNA